MLCHCQNLHSRPRKIVITGGPGGGKTAVLELGRRELCSHLHIVPEVASLLLSTGYFKRENFLHRNSLQRSIFFLQKELENINGNNSALILCDRGTLDGLAYWESSEETFWKEVGSSKAQELLRYDIVIHLRTPHENNGYNNHNPHRIETVSEALVIDEKILEVWKDHPRRIIIDSSDKFLLKAQKAIDLIKAELPACCLTDKNHIK